MYYSLFFVFISLPLLMLLPHLVTLFAPLSPAINILRDFLNLKIMLRGCTLCPWALPDFKNYYVVAVTKTVQYWKNNLKYPCQKENPNHGKTSLNQPSTPHALFQQSQNAFPDMVPWLLPIPAA